MHLNVAKKILIHCDFKYSQFSGGFFFFFFYFSFKTGFCFFSEKGAGFFVGFFFFFFFLNSQLKRDSSVSATRVPRVML